MDGCGYEIWNDSCVTETCWVCLRFMGWLGLAWGNVGTGSIRVRAPMDAGLGLGVLAEGRLLASGNRRSVLLVATRHQINEIE